MKKTKILFIIWGVLVVVILGLLTTLGFMLKKTNKEYRYLEDTLKVSGEKYSSDNFIYPPEGEKIIISKDTLIKEGYLEKLEYNNDVCDGYVEVSKNNVALYKAFIKCNKYTTKGYKKN